MSTLTANKKSPSIEQLIKSKKAVVGVIGLGYVGLPLVRLFALKGFRVMGFDIDQTKIDMLEKGQSYIKSIPNALLKKFKKRFTATSDFTRLKEADAIIICVPTPLLEDGRPDL